MRRKSEEIATSRVEPLYAWRDGNGTDAGVQEVNMASLVGGPAQQMRIDWPLHLPTCLGSWQPATMPRPYVTEPLIESVPPAADTEYTPASADSLPEGVIGHLFVGASGRTYLRLLTNEVDLRAARTYAETPWTNADDPKRIEAAKAIYGERGLRLDATTHQQPAAEVWEYMPESKQLARSAVETAVVTLGVHIDE